MRRTPTQSAAPAPCTGGRSAFDSASCDGNITGVRTRAVVFDLDGTLLDSLADIGESMNLVLERDGMPVHPLADYREFVGDGITMLARRALPEGRRDNAAVARAAASMRQVYSERLAVRTRPYDGIPELLDALHRRGTKLAVLSNKLHEMTVALVEKLLARWTFDPVFGERPSVPKKPDPASALEIAGLLGIAPAAIAYVGDTRIDMETARRAGMLAIGAAWGFRPESELRTAGAAAIARTPLDVLKLVG